MNISFGNGSLMIINSVLNLQEPIVVHSGIYKPNHITKVEICSCHISVPKGMEVVTFDGEVTIDNCVIVEKDEG